MLPACPAGLNAVISLVLSETWIGRARRGRGGRSPRVGAGRAGHRTVSRAGSCRRGRAPRRRPPRAGGRAQSLDEPPITGVDRSRPGCPSPTDGRFRRARLATSRVSASSVGSVSDPLGDRDDDRAPAATAHTATRSTVTADAHSTGLARNPAPWASAARRPGRQLCRIATSSGYLARRSRGWTKIQTRARFTSDDRDWREKPS